MQYPSGKIKVTKRAGFLIRDGLNKILAHRGFLALLWSVFYIPTTLFSYFRVDSAISQTDPLAAPQWDVLFMITILNILGYVPMIGMALLIREEDQDEYNGIVLDAFRRIPFFFTTTLAAVLRMLLPAILLYLPAVFLAVPMTTAGWSENLILGVLVPYFILVFLVLFLRYYSAGMSYLMKDVRNFTAVRYSVNLFRSNRAVMIPLLLGCFILPSMGSFAAAFLIENRLMNMGISLLLNAYLYIATGVFANLFLHIKEGESSEIV